jgi:hypothetical protein
MDTKLRVRRWQDWSNLVLGAWLFFSPWLIQYPSDTLNATWNAHIVGAAIVLFAALAVYMPRIWEEGLNVVLGIWTIISPWVLGFASYRNVTTNAVIVGVLVTALAAWAILHDKGFEKGRYASS